MHRKRKTQSIGRQKAAVEDEDDDVARMRAAVQAVANGARQFMARLDPLNVPWLCALLMDQLLQ